MQASYIQLKNRLWISNTWEQKYLAVEIWRQKYMPKQLKRPHYQGIIWRNKYLSTKSRSGFTNHATETVENTSKQPLKITEIRTLKIYNRLHLKTTKWRIRNTLTLRIFLGGSDRENSFSSYRFPIFTMCRYIP